MVQTHKSHVEVLTFELKSKAQERPKAEANTPASTDDHRPTSEITFVSSDMVLQLPIKMLWRAISKSKRSVLSKYDVRVRKLFHSRFTLASTVSCGGRPSEDACVSLQVGVVL